MCQLYNSWRLGDILEWLGTNVKYQETMFDQSLQGQGDVLRSNTLLCLLYIFWNPGGIYKWNKSAQMASMMSWRAVRMFDQGWFKVTVII